MGENSDRIKGFFTHSAKNGLLILIFAGAVIGIILLLFGDGDGNASESNCEVRANADISEYRAEQESKIAALVANVGGVGRVSVAVALDGGFEYVYAQNVSDKNGTGSSTYVTIGSGSSESPVYLRVKAPQISGIGVVCDGGNDPRVRMEVVNLLSAVYGIGSNKIYVTGRKSE